MKRAGFTMIELIFVIVILGILASVAVPKLLGVKSSAEEGIVKSFVGSLNTTTGPAKWSQSLMDGNSGTIKKSTKASYDITTTDTDFPSGFASTSNGTTNCQAAGASITPSATTAIMSGTAGSTTFYILCVDGTSSTAPKFYYTSKTTAVTLSGTNLKL